MFFVSTVKSVVTVIANDKEFLKNLEVIDRIITCFHCNSVLYYEISNFCVNLIDPVRENQCFLSKHY